MNRLLQSHKLIPLLGTWIRSMALMGAMITRQNYLVADHLPIPVRGQ